MVRYRRAGSRIAIQLIADQRQVLASGGVEIRGAASELDYWALTPINEVQNRLIEYSDSAAGVITLN